MPHHLTKNDLHEAIETAKARCISSREWDALEHLRRLAVATYRGEGCYVTLPDPLHEDT